MTGHHGDQTLRTSPRRRLGARVMTVVLVALTPLSACGGQDVDVPGTPATASTAPPTDDAATAATATAAAPAADTGAARGPESAYRAWLDALARQDAATACVLQHPALTIDLRFQAIAVDRAELGDPCVGFEAVLWEDPTRSYDPADVETTRDTGEKATLAVTFPPRSPTPEVTVELLFHRAQWRVRSEARRGAGVGDTDRWVEAWCDLSTEDSRAEVVDRMGPPSGTYTVGDGGEPQLYWASDQYDFRAYLDPVTDRVLDLVGDYDALTAADRRRLDCPELR